LRKRSAPACAALCVSIAPIAFSAALQVDEINAIGATSSSRIAPVLAFLTWLQEQVRACCPLRPELTVVGTHLQSLREPELVMQFGGALLQHHASRLGDQGITARWQLGC
jgi:hypothetical protein